MVHSNTPNGRTQCRPLLSLHCAIARKYTIIGGLYDFKNFQNEVSCFAIAVCVAVHSQKQEGNII